MCGICGFNWNDKILIEKMTHILYHRGPDQKGILIDDDISLGTRRLSIIDLSDKGRQPMSNEDESIFIVYNGEIYNFKDLRKNLEMKKHDFKSNTDTEVIIHSYEQWGEDCVKKFNGMFAFAIWDSNKKQLFLARDRLGIKPLFYYCNSDQFIFASEIKSILLNTQLKKEIDETALYYYLGYEYIPAPLTIFKGIKKVLPGHILIYKNGSMISKKYWDLIFQNTYFNEKYYANKIYELLKDSVERRLISDVPLGAFLSGGIDSSAIVGLMSQLMDEPVKTFSIGYEDETYSELDYARQVSEYFATDHTEILIDPFDIENYEKVIWYLDEPMSEFSLLPVYMFCKNARKEVTVALSGEGGDELFAGYERFLANRIDGYYKKIHHTLRNNLITNIIDKFPFQPQKKGTINVLKRFINGSNLNIKGKQMRWQYFSNKNDELKLYSKSLILNTQNIDSFDYINNYYHKYNSIDEINKQICIELNTFLLNNCLVKVDKMSMANSLEVRVPYLDHLFVEFSTTIPGYLKLKRYTTKYIFKKAMSGLLQNNIIKRKKQGFSMPIKNWLRNELKNYMLDTLHNSKIIKEKFNSYYLNKIMDQHIRGSYDHSHRLWSLINLELWYKCIYSNQIFSD